MVHGDQPTKDELIEGHFLYQLGDFIESRRKGGRTTIGDLDFPLLRYFFKSGWLWAEDAAQKKKGRE